MYRAFNAVFGKIDIRSLQYVVDCFRQIFGIKLKETVEECMREFNVSTVNDAIDARPVPD